MQTTELSLTFTCADPLPHDTSERIKKICLDRLQLSPDQTDALCQHKGPLSLTSYEEPAQLQGIISELTRLGVLVESKASKPRLSALRDHRPPRSHPRRKPRRTVYPVLTDSPRERQIPLRAAISRQVAVTAATIALVMGIGSAGALFWSGNPSVSRLEAHDFNAGGSEPLAAPSEIPPSRIFLGTANFSPLRLTVQASQRGDTISVRLFSDGTQSSLTDSFRIERIESDPTFLTAKSADTFVGHASVVFTVVTAGESHQISGIFAIALRTSNTGMPREASIQLTSPTAARSPDDGFVDTLPAQLEVFSTSTDVELLAG